MITIGILIVGYFIFEPSIDRTSEGKYLLWYNGINKRKFIILCD